MMNRVLARLFLLALVGILVFPALSDAQITRGAVSGTVRDASGPAIGHNVPPERIQRPSAWAAFGADDPQGADFRACREPHGGVDGLKERAVVDDAVRGRRQSDGVGAIDGECGRRGVTVSCGPVVSGRLGITFLPEGRPTSPHSASGAVGPAH